MSAVTTRVNARPQRLWMPHAIGLLVTILFVASIVIQLGEGEDVGSQAAFLAFFIATLAIGWLVAWKQPGNPLGWMLLAVAGVSGIQYPMLAGGVALLPYAPAVARWVIWASAEGDSNWTWFIAVWLLLIQLPLRFPDGSLPSPRWRWVSWAGVAVLVFGCAVLSGSTGDPWKGVASPWVIPAAINAVLTPLLIGVLAAAFVGSMAAMIVRYRHGSEQLRAQIRWVLWAVSIAMTVLIASQFLPAATPYVVLLSLWAGGYLLVPVAIGVSVLKYRLYSIDRIIARTVSYAIVTAVIVGLYVGLVIGFTLLLPNLPTVGIAIATLVAAAVFLPLLRRVQRFIDRRFNRAQYSAQQVVDGFGDRLRSGSDPHGAGDDLIDAVEQTLQPLAVGIWTRAASR